MFKPAKCSPIIAEDLVRIPNVKRGKCKEKCLKRKKCLAFQYKRKSKRRMCKLLFYTPEVITQKSTKNTCGIVYFPTEFPSSQPSPISTSPWLSKNQWMTWGRVDFDLNDDQFILQSEKNSDLGVLVSTHAFNDTDIDFIVEYDQETFEDDHSGYEAQPYLFFVPTGTYPEILTQTDNQFSDFEQIVVGYVRSKIFTSTTNPIDHTWFRAGNRANTDSFTSSTSNRLKSLSLRIRKYNNEIYAYYRQLVDDGEWIQIGSSLPLADDVKNIPLQVGIRVKKEWKSLYNFTMRVQKLAGGKPIKIPTKAPTAAPTETKTWIKPETEHKPPSCPSNFDRSSQGMTYEMRGIGGGGAMSGLSISPWNSLWFVGTDMGTLFRSTDGGNIWNPVSHDEQTFTYFLSLSGPVGFTSDADTLVFASCKNPASYKCVARRSTDAGITWSPINVTGGMLTDSEGNPALDYVPLQWVGSLLETSDIMFATMHDGGGIYRSSDNGLNWSKVSLPFNDTNIATGLFFDQSSSPPQLYFATSHGIFMWEDGEEASAREIWRPTNDETLIKSFTGGRSATGRLTLAIVDNNVTACEGQSDKDCGYIYLSSGVFNASIAMTKNFSFSKTSQRAFRVVSSPTDGSLIYATGARSWPNARGTAVWVGKWIEDQNNFSFSLKLLQSDVDNMYSKWPADKLDYSAVGLDVGYWDGGYYTFFVNPKNSSEAGGSGNFFLHTTKSAGEHWESPFTEHADSCHTDGGSRGKGQRWRSTGLEMTSVRWLKFNPYNISYGFASVADIRMLRTDDSGETWSIAGGSKSGLFSINTLYDYAFAGPHTVFAVGGNFHDWPHGWYKNLLRGAGGVFISVDSGIGKLWLLIRLLDI